MTILTPFFARFLVYVSLGERSSEVIGQKYLIQKRSRINGGNSCLSVASIRHDIIFLLVI